MFFFYRKYSNTYPNWSNLQNIHQYFKSTLIYLIYISLNVKYENKIRIHMYYETRSQQEIENNIFLTSCLLQFLYSCICHFKDKILYSSNVQQL